jgi:GNAT superfamily N-acetyltransferase
VATIQVRSVPLPQTRALRHSILRPHQHIKGTVAAEPDGAHAVGAFDGEELIAAGLIAPDPERPGSWRVRGMATKAPARGRGAGTAVLAALLDRARAEGARRVWCNVRTPARSLYERAGFRTVSDEFELPGIGPHFVMELILGANARRSRERSLLASTKDANSARIDQMTGPDCCARLPQIARERQGPQPAGSGSDGSIPSVAQPRTVRRSETARGAICRE